MTTPSTSAQGPDTRPVNCRFRLQDEGKAYPKSSCTACGRTIVTGLGAYCTVTASPPPAASTPGGDMMENDTLSKTGQASAFDFVAHWHEEQGRRFRSMSEDHPRIDEETCAKAGDASRHHFGSAVALRLRAADIRRAALSSSAGPAEAVAWVQPGYLSMLQKYGSCSMRFEPIDALDYIVPIYAHPAPATVEMLTELEMVEKTAAALVVMARNNIPPDIQELLVAGNPDRSIPPGILKRVLAEADGRQVQHGAALAPATEGRKG